MMSLSFANVTKIFECLQVILGCSAVGQMVHIMLFSHGFPFCCPDFLQEFSAGSMDKQFKLELCHQFLDCSRGSRSQGAEKSLVN